MYQNILTLLSEHILTITINRGNKLNALNRDTLSELSAVFSMALKNEGIKGIIITGAGNKAFVAGADITELKDLDTEGGHNLSFEGHTKVFDLIATSNKPVIAAINGFALGGGLELALACHIRVASENAMLGLPEVNLGLIPGYGGTQRLPQIIGKGRALEMILTGEPINAAEAHRIGLVNQVVPAGEALNKACYIMKTILKRSSIAVSAAIRAVISGEGKIGYKSEISEFSKCFGSTDFQEGINAFLHKRKPQF